MPTVEKGFSHRVNRGGSIDSICHTCFMTIGTATGESELESMENAHSCNPNETLRREVLAEEAKLAR